MSCCVSISVSRTPPGYLGNVSALRFEITDNIELTEQVAELSEGGTFRQGGVFDLDLEDTNRNRFIISQFYNKNDVAPEIPVVFYCEGIQMPEDTLKILGFDNGKWQVRLFRGLSFIEAAKTVKLSELGGFDPYLHGEAAIAAINVNGFVYASTQKGYWFPVLFWGGLHKLNGSNYELTHLDHRPLISIRKLLEVGFCSAGYNFSSPLFEGEIGTRWFGYLGTEGQKNYDGNAFFSSLWGVPTSWQENLSIETSGNMLVVRGGDNYRFKALKTINQPIVTPFIVQFEDDAVNGYDNGSSVVGTLGAGFWAPVGAAGYSGMINTRGLWKIKWSLIVVSAAAGTATLSMKSVTFATGGGVGGAVAGGANSFYGTNGASPITFSHPGGGTAQIWEGEAFYDNYVDFGQSCLYLNSTTAMTVNLGSSIEGVAESIYIWPNCNFYDVSTKTFRPNFDIPPDLIVFPQSYIGTNMTLAELLAGVAHFFDGVIYFNEGARRVTLMPREKTLHQGFSYDGYYQSLETDLSGWQICDSHDLKFLEQRLKSNQFVGFKSESDEYAKTVGKDLFGYETDISDIVLTDPGRNENRNPLFEPTVERDFLEIEVPGAFPITVGVVADNLDGVLTGATGARIFYSVDDDIIQSNGTTTPSTPRGYKRFVGGVSVTPTLFAYAKQVSLRWRHFGTSSIQPFGKDIRYGQDTSDDLFKFWRYSILRPASYVVHRLGLFVKSLSDFRKMDFRKLYNFNIDGRNIKGRLIKKQGFDLCEKGEMEIEFKEEGPRC